MVPQSKTFRKWYRVSELTQVSVSCLSLRVVHTLTVSTKNILTHETGSSRTLKKFRDEKYHNFPLYLILLE